MLRHEWFAPAKFYASAKFYACNLTHSAATQLEALDSSDDDALKKLHHALLEVEVVTGRLVRVLSCHHTSTASSASVSAS